MELVGIYNVYILGVVEASSFDTKLGTCLDIQKNRKKKKNSIQKKHWQTKNYIVKFRY